MVKWFDLHVMRLLVCGVVLLGLVPGCKPVARRDARERNHQIVQRAYALLEAGDYREAMDHFREALDVNPTLARPHLDLALLLHEHAHDYVRAIYHYERYLELRAGTEKQGLIRARVEQARLALVASYGGTQTADRVSDAVSASDEVLDGGALDAALARAQAAEAAAAEARELVLALQQERDGLRVAVAEHERQIEVQQTQINQQGAQVRRLEEQIVRSAAEDRPTATVPVVPPAVEPVVSAVEERVVEVSSAGARTYVVRANDSLSVIAQRVYGNAAKWPEIRAANREVLGDSEVLLPGQVLVIP